MDLLCYTPEAFAGKRRELGIESLALDEGLTLRETVAPKKGRAGDTLACLRHETCSK